MTLTHDTPPEQTAATGPDSSPQVYAAPGSAGAVMSYRRRPASRPGRKESLDMERVDVTDEAAALLRSLAATHGSLMFHQSGGCCDGSSPMCYPVGMFRTGASDVRLGDLAVDGIDPMPVYMSRSQYELWKYTHLTIDVVDGRGAGDELAALGVASRFAEGAGRGAPAAPAR